MDNVRKQIDDWREGVHDRVDNLCAIYKCADLRGVVDIVMTADSMVMCLYRLLCEAADDDDERSTKALDDLGDRVSEALTAIVVSAIDLVCVEDKDTLTDDIMRIINTRYQLEDKLNGHP
jgi:predicted house-cleaning NTP pyrophosphatase (Maf/HAM1 superfamily)